jgi:glycosyltransferase involved in cell wall biosynthesis
MHILFLVDSLGKGGSERRMLELIKHASRTTNYTISLICLSNFVEYPEVYDLPIKFIVIKRKFKKDPFVFFSLFGLIRKLKPDIIHSWSSMSNMYAVPIAKMKGLKMITSVIADSPGNLSLKNKAYLRAKLAFPFVDRITSNSLAGIDAYHPPLKKTSCIYNGFDYNRISSLETPYEVKKRLGITGELVIGMVARFEGRKDYESMIIAAKAVLEKEPGIVFLLIGDGPMREEVMKQVTDAHSKKILFPGRINNVESYINLFDVAVLCTNTKVHQEGISNSIMEYMALGKPVIATAGGGTDEIVVDEVTGFLIPPHDAKVLSEKMMQLANDVELRRRLGERGNKRIRELFTIDRMCEQFYSLYNELT